MQKSTSKTQWLLTLSKSTFQEGEANANEKQLEGWQKNEVRRLTLKEREQKVYPFPNEDVPNIFEQLLQMKLIEFPECRRPEDMGKVDDTNYCKYHRIIGHPIQKCFVFKEQIMKHAKENKIDLNFNEVVGSNHVTFACDVLSILKQGQTPTNLTSCSTMMMQGSALSMGSSLSASMLENQGFLLGKSLNYPL